MPRLLPEGYFTTGAFAAAGPELFRTYTCVGCGHRSATWAAFKAHRTAGCSERLWVTPVGSEAWRADAADAADDDAPAAGEPALTLDDLDHLAALAAQVDPPG